MDAEADRDHADQHRGRAEMPAVGPVRLPLLRRADQEHHEQVQHHDAARVDQDLDDRQELGAQQDVHRGHAEQRDDEVQRAVYRVPPRDHHPGGEQADGGEHGEQDQGRIGHFLYVLLGCPLYSRGMSDMNSRRSYLASS